MSIKRLIRLVISVFPLLVTAVIGLRAEPASEPVVSANLKCLSMTGDINGVDILVSLQKRIPVSAPANYISKAVAYVGPAKLILIRAKKKPEPPAPGAVASPAPLPAAPNAAAAVEAPEILGTVEIPPPGGDFLLMFSGSAETKLNLLAVPFSAKDLPAGSCLVWNITGRPLGMVMGGEKALLPVGGKQMFKPAPSASNQNYCDLIVSDEYQGKVRPLISGDHYLKRDDRQLIFITERIPGQVPIRIKVIQELYEAKPAKSAPAPKSPTGSSHDGSSQ